MTESGIVAVGIRWRALLLQYSREEGSFSPLAAAATICARSP